MTRDVFINPEHLTTRDLEFAARVLSKHAGSEAVDVDDLEFSQAVEKAAAAARKFPCRGHRLATAKTDTILARRKKRQNAEGKKAADTR